MKRLTTEEFIEKTKLKHGDKYDYSEVEYINSTTPVKIKCNNCGKFFYQTAHHHLNSCKCKCMRGGPRKSLEDILNDFRKTHKDDYDYSLIKEAKSDDQKVNIICKTCGFVFSQKIRNHINGDGCPKCGREKLRKSRLITQEEFIERSKAVHGNKYDYSLVDFKGTHTPVTIICKIHGPFQQMPFKHMQKRGCPKCKESYGEKAIRVFLEKNDIEYIYQNYFDDFKYPYDFYLPKLNIAIEFDGEQHHSCDNFFSKKKALKKNTTPEVILEEQIKIDKLKTDFCSENNIKLIRIEKIELVNEILTNVLNVSKTIDLSEIKSTKTIFNELGKKAKKDENFFQKIICIETGEIKLRKNTNITTKVLKGNGTYKGFHWRVFSVNEIGNSELIQKNNQEFMKPILERQNFVVCKETGKRYNSIKEAVKDITGEYNENKSSNISRAISRGGTALGYHWYYLSSFE